MKGDIPELRKLRRELRWRGGAPETLGPQRGGAGHQGVVEHVDGGAELPPQSGGPRGLHVSSSRDGSCTSPQAHPTTPDVLSLCYSVSVLSTEGSLARGCLRAA